MLCCALCFKTKDDSVDDFFKVPKDQRRRKRWGEICRIDFKKRAAWICKDHFLPSEIIKCGNKKTLLPNTVPFIPPVKEPEKIIEAYKKSHTKNTEKTVGKYREEKLPQRILDTSDTNLPQIQEGLVVEIPIEKKIFCTRPTQTNTRLCGLIDTSEFADDFRLNCFYCSIYFPFQKWKAFIKHLKKKHFKNEKAFETWEYISEEHDYTPTNLPVMSSVHPVLETIGISSESLLPYLGKEDVLTIPINTTFYTVEENLDMPDNIHIPNTMFGNADQLLTIKQEYPNNDLAQDIKNEFSVEFDTLDNIIGSRNASSTSERQKRKKSTNVKNKSAKPSQMKSVFKQATRKTVLSRFLRRTVREDTDLEGRGDYSSTFTTIKQQHTPVISYEYSPSAIIDLLLESMRNYPALWQFNTEPFNDDFSRSIAELCKIINDKWSLNIDHLTMRRSINRILRFYCYLFPNENIENIHPFTCYYDKCAEFLPSSVGEIAYARCSNCYICYKNDFDLKRHLLKEQSFDLKWPYKCVECKECFKESDEYEFHKRLPHYTEVFRCEPCNKKYLRRNIYNRHISEYHPKEIKGRIFKCDECDKAYRTQGSLKAHKIFHGERKYKCHLCSKDYHENAKLQIHLKTHRREFDFICEVCAKEFVTQSALNVHMNMHTGEKINCTICNLKLRKSSLSRHLRLLHTASDGNVSQNVIQRSKGKVKSYKRLVRKRPFTRRKEFERRKYQCKVCKLNFENYKPLAEHNKEMHSDLPKWPCQLCATVFSLKVNLKRHYRRKHNLHVIQVYKLVEEGDDLSDVLSIKTEQLKILADNGVCSTKNTSMLNVPKVKSEFLSDEDSIGENMQSFAIQDDITKEEIKINYMNDFFADM